MAAPIRFKAREPALVTKQDIIGKEQDAVGPTAGMTGLHHRAETPDHFLQPATNLA